jgi:hypothetical protein
MGPGTGLDNLEGRIILLYRDSNFDILAVEPVTSLYTDCAELR